MKSPPKNTLLIVALILIGVMVMALATALLSDLGKLREAFQHIEPSPFLFALFTMMIAYLTSALSFRALFNLTPYRVPFSKFFSIMFISDTVNFIVSSAGMSSLGNRALLLKQEKVPYSVSIPLSLIQNMVFNLVLSCVCLGGLGYLQEHPEFTGGLKPGALLTFVAGLLLVVGGMLVFFYNRFFRRWSLGQMFWVNGWFNRLFQRKKTPLRQLAEARGKLEDTLALLNRDWTVIFLVFFWVALNWCFMALTFYFCFRTAGVGLSPGLLLLGFTVMFLSSNLNPVPAGLGISESLVAYTFKFLGLGFEKALVAALFFRLVYYLIPLGVSMTLYIDTIRKILKYREDRLTL